MEKHLQYVADIATQIKKYNDSGSEKKLRFKHGSTNSTRSSNGEYEYIDVGMLNRVLEVNTEEKWALVEPNVPMDTLAEETLKHNLLPEVVMEFPGITVGGGIQGAGLESSPFKYGQFNDTCIEYELITANGQIIKASAHENQDIFYGISSSYGTLAVLTMVKLRLIPAKKYVQLTYKPYSTSESVVEALKKEVNQDNDFLEGIIFSAESSVVITGKFISEAQHTQTFSNATDPWFYKHAKDIAKKGKEYKEYVPMWDYLFRYNRGAFWMGEYTFSLFHVPNNRITKRLLNRYMNTRTFYKAMHIANVTQDYLIQDYYYPFETATDYLKFNQENLKIYPIWLCPIKATDTAQKLSPHYSTQQKILLNIGIYGQSKEFLKRGYLNANREVEQLAISKHARKMFYAHSYYPKEEFWNVYDYPWYKELRTKYHADKAFPEIWEKIYVSKKYKPNLYSTLMPYLLKEVWQRLTFHKE